MGSYVVSNEMDMAMCKRETDLPMDNGCLFYYLSNLFNLPKYPIYLKGKYSPTMMELRLGNSIHGSESLLPYFLAPHLSNSMVECR